jgi:hypothetical protein
MLVREAHVDLQVRMIVPTPSPSNPLARCTPG